MRLFLLLIFLCVATPALATRVLLEKGTGRLIEYQSHATAGTLLRNAEVAGIDLSTVEELEVSNQEWAAIRETQLDAPARAKNAVKQAKRNSAINKIKASAGLTGDEAAALFR